MIGDILKKRLVQIEFDDFTNSFRPKVKMFNLFWTYWFNDGKGKFRAITATRKMDVYNFLQKITESNNNKIKFIILENK